MCERGSKRTDLGPPPRWLKCPRKGTLIADKLLPFKTPLDESYKDQIPMECTFTPQMMMASMAGYKVKMGLWIDLTNTNRFYNRKIVEGLDVKYIKLSCQGHSACPTQDQTKAFVELCRQFVTLNPLEVIGVHCTHGYNRTGFLIVAYLVEILCWSVEAAVKAFAMARPPGIYKKDYLKELFQRYGDVDDAPPAPPLPDWCNETEDVDDDGKPLEASDNNRNEFIPPHKKRRREFIKKNPEFMEGVPGVTPVTDPDVVSSVQRKCQDMCGWQGSGFPGSQPVSMDIANINLLGKMPYKVSWKADGTRYMMLIDGHNRIYFIDRDNSVFKVSHMLFPRRKAPDQHIFDTLLDGEMIIDKVDGIDVPRYLAYDIVKFEGLDVGQTEFHRRELCIDKEIVKTRLQAMQEGKIDRAREPFSIRAKQFYDLTAARSILSEKFSKNMSHDVDGLIFQPVPTPYIAGRCAEVLKWKPSTLNSVDFKLSIVQTSGEGMLTKRVGYLYVGGLNTPFGEIKVTKDLKNYDKKIVECKYEDGKWVFLRERTDKSFPNSYSTAMGVCNSIRNPVTTEKLFFFIDHHRWLQSAKPKDPPTE